MERNQYLESDGIYFESETHEWFNDNCRTSYSQSNNGSNNDALKNIFCFVVREKITGEYDRVIMDSNLNAVIFSSKSLEGIGFEIDKMKVLKRFNIVSTPNVS
jgi:hypothetical protein